MRVIGDMVGYLRQMLRHSVGIAPRHDQSRRLAELGADCTEDIGGFAGRVARTVLSRALPSGG